MLADRNFIRVLPINKDSSQLRHGLFTLLFGLRIRSHGTYRRRLQSSTHPAYEEGEAEQTRHVDLDSLEEQRLAAVMRQAVTTNNFGAITIAMSRKPPLTLATSSSGASRRLTTCTSSLPLGKDLSSSLKMSVHRLTT
jgi:hypothetical protein